MESTLWNEIVKLAPLWWIIAVVIIVISMKFYYTRFKKVEDKVEHSNCKEHKIKIDSCEKVANDNTSRILTIELTLIEKGMISVDTLSKARSPRVLTEDGIELYEISGGKKIMDEHINRFMELIDKRSPKTALDVENYAKFVLATDVASDDVFIPIKTYIYNNPVFKGKDITIYTVCFVMSFPLRDAYLLAHPEITA